MWFFGPSEEELNANAELYTGDAQQNKLAKQSIFEPQQPADKSPETDKPILNLRQANLDLATKIWGKIAAAKGISQDKMKKGLDLSRDLLKSSETTVNTYEDNIAKNMFKEKFMRDANADDLSIFKQSHNQQIQDSLYANLQWDAKTLGIDLTGDQAYQDWVARTVSKETPKRDESKETWGKKATDVLKGLAGTVVGTGAIISDWLGLTDNAYKSYFTDQTELTGKEGVWAKAWDLLWKQWAWMDIGFAAATVLTGGVAAPAWIGAKTAMGIGLKSVGKFAVKEILKEWAEGIGKTLLREGAEFTEKEILEGLTKTIAEDVIKTGVKWATEDVIMKATRSVLTWEGVAELAKTTAGKKLTDAITSSLTRNVGEKLSEKASKWFGKQVAKFAQMTGTINDISQLSTKGKFILGASNIADALGIPGLQQLTLAPLGGKVVAKEADKGIGWFLAKQGLRFDTSLPRVMIHWGLPFAGTLPAVGNFITDNFMMVGTTAAGMFAKATRIGIVDKERQAFIAAYGIDPDKTDNISIKKAFEEKINFSIRNALPSQILTGVSYNERWLFWQAATSVVDGLLNMSGILIGSKIIGHSLGIAQEHLEPYTKDENGNVVSRIGFVKEINEIYANYNRTEGDPLKIDLATRNKQVADVQNRLDHEDPTLVKTIHSVKEFEATRKELHELLTNGAEKMTSADAAFEAMIGKAADIDSVIEMQKEHTKIAGQLFSESRISELTAKQEALAKYLKKVGESTSFYTQVTRPIVDNIFTSNRLSPVHALINYNKFDKINEDALTKMNAYQNGIKDPIYNMALFYSQKGELLKNPGIINTELEKQVRRNLASHGASDAQIDAIWKPLSQEIQLATTRVFLNLPEASIQEVFAKTFGDIWVTLDKRFSKSVKGQENKIAAIISGISWEQKKNALGDIVISFMDKKTQELLQRQGDAKNVYQQTAMELLRIDQLKSDAIGHLNREAEIDRADVLSNVPTETKTAFTQKEIDAHVKEIDEQIAATTDPKKKEQLEQIKSAILTGWGTNDEPVKIDADTVKTVATPAVIKQMDGEKHIETEVEKQQEIEKANEEIKIKAQNVARIFANAYSAHEQLKAQKMILDREAKRDPNVPEEEYDNISTSSILQQSAITDFALRQIPNLAAYYKANLDFSKRIDVKDIYKLSGWVQGELQKKIKEKVALVNFDEMDQDKANDTLVRLATKALDEAAQQITSDTIRHIAYDSNNIAEFKANLVKTFWEKLWLNAEFSNNVIKNFLQDKDVYIYNLYKNTVEMPFVIIGLDWKVTANVEAGNLKVNRAAFADKNGRYDHLYRLTGTGEDLYKKHGAVFVGGYTDADGVSVDPTQKFHDYDVEDKAKAYRDEMAKYEEVMLKNGYEYVGSFQEEGNKNIFVPIGNADKFLEDLNWMPVNVADQFSPRGKEIYAQEVQNRAKQMTWNDPKLDKEETEKYFQGTGRNQITFITFKSPDHLGEIFYTPNFTQLNNISIGASKDNISGKPAMTINGDSLGKGQFTQMQADLFHDGNIREAVINFANSSNQTYWPEGKRLKDVIAENGFATPKGRQNIMNFINENKVVEGFIGDDSYKSPIKKLLKPESNEPQDIARAQHDREVLERNGIPIYEFKSGGIVTVDTDKYAVQARDEYIDADYTKNEQIKLTRQFQTNTTSDETSPTYDLDQSHKIETYNLISDIQAKKLEKMNNMLAGIVDNDVGFIEDFAKEFGIKYNDINFQQYLTSKNLDNVINMITNTAMDEVLTATKVKGNKMIMRVLPGASDYTDVNGVTHEGVDSKINAFLRSQFPNKDPESINGNFVVVSRKTHPHLANEDGSIPRELMIRHPIADANGINFPYIIFDDQLKDIAGITYDMQGWVYVAGGKLLNRIEGDHDADKAYIYKDPQLNPLREGWERINDESFKSVPVVHAKPTRAYNATDYRGIFKEAGERKIESKLSIGSIDNSNLIDELLIDSGFINNSASIGTKSSAQTVRELGAKFLKNAHDGWDVSMAAVKKAKAPFFSFQNPGQLSRGENGKPLIFVPEVIANKWVKNIGDVQWHFYDKEGKVIEKNWKPSTGGLFQTKEGVAASMAVLKKIQSKIDELSRDPKNYKIVEVETKYGTKKKVVQFEKDAAIAIQNTLKKYSIDNITNNFRKVLSFVGKKDWVDVKEWDEVVGKEQKNRQATRFEEQYNTIRPNIDFIKELQKDGIISGDNQISIFLDKIADKLTQFNNNTRVNAREWLKAKHDQVFESIKRDIIPKENVAPELIPQLKNISAALRWDEKFLKKALVEENKEKYPKMSKAKAEALKKQVVAKIETMITNAKEALQTFKVEHPEVDTDNFLIHDNKFSDLNFRLLNTANQKMINNEMTHQLTLGKYDELENMWIKPSEIMELKRAEPGTQEYEDTFNRIVKSHAEWSDDFTTNESKYGSYNVSMPLSQKMGIQEGIKPEEFTSALKDIESLPKEQAVQTRVAISELNPEHLALLDLKDPDIRRAVAFLIGLKDSQDISATHQVIDAKANKDPLLVRADPSKTEEYERQSTEINNKKEEALDIVRTTDLSLRLLDILKEHRDDPYSPVAQAKMQKAMNDFHNSLASGKLKDANDRVFANTNARTQLKEAQQAMYDYLEKTNATGNLPGIAGAVQDFLLKTYKSLTLGFSVGRGITEWAQAWVLAVTNKIDQVMYSKYNRKNIATLLEITEDKLPNAGRIVSETSLGNREFGNETNPMQKNMAEKPELLKKLSYIPSKMMEVTAWGMEKTVGPIEQFFYETEFNRAMWEWVEKNPKERSILFKDNLSTENRIRRDNIIQQWKREARDSTKKAYFDYSTNPLIINKLETYIPFTNFMYNGINMMQKYPMTFMFGATVLNNLQYAYGQQALYVDDEGQKIDAGMSLRLPILASLGLDSVALNMNRVLQVSPGSLGIKPAGWYNVITGRDDPRFQKFYKSGSMMDYIDIGLSMMSPPLARVVNAIINYNQTKDIEGKKYNALAELNSAMAYATTGLLLTDKSTSKAWDMYINKDYEGLLNMSPLQLNRFLEEDSIVKKGVTLQTLKALQKANKIGVFGTFDDPFQEAMVTMGALPLHDSIGTRARLESDGKLIANLTETVLGKNFSGAEEGNFQDTLEKWKQMYKDPSFKEFEKAVPGMGKAIRHFVENEPYYTERNKAYDMIKSGDKDTALKWELRLIALQYRFVWDEDMTLNEKVSAIQYGKLDTPLFYGSSKDGIPAHSVQMTDEYKASLQYKGDLTYNYIQKTNGISALNSLRKAFVTMAYASSKTADKNKYFALAKDAYNESLKAEHEMKVMCSPEYALFQLSGDYKKFEEYTKTKTDWKDYAKTTNWSTSFAKNREIYMASTAKQREANIQKLIDLSNSLSTDEKTFMKDALGTDVKANIDYFNKIRGDSSASSGIQTLKDLLDK